MIELLISAFSSVPELLVAAGYPTDETLELLTTRGEAIEPGWLGGTNEIWMGKPITFDLPSLYAVRKAPLAPMIAQLLPAWDFLLVRLTCSFRPAAECAFMLVSLRVRLEPQRPAILGDAIAYHMEPKDVTTPRTVKRSLSISPSLKLKLTNIGDAEASLGKAERADEYIVYEPQISTFGLGSESPGWDFSPTKAQELRGSRELFLVVQLPRGTVLTSRFELAATVQTKVGPIRLPTFRRGGSAELLVDERHTLVPQ